MSTGDWQDVSIPLDEGTTTFPDTPAVAVERVASLGHGDDATVSRLELSTHSGTHIDAPLHFLARGASTEEIGLETVNGPAQVIDATGGRRIGAETIGEADAGLGARVLLRSDNSELSDPPWYRREFDPEYAHLSAEGAEALAAAGVAAVGLDYLSIGGEGIDNERTHRILLEAGVTILEGLALERVEPGSYELRCLPLPLSDADGAPARALLRPQ